MDLKSKLEILADAAKYDASCASSGGAKRDSLDRKGIGSSGGSGICHSYTPDGRCVSLLKILLTNACIYDCLYCINRSSSHVRRARFSVEEVVKLTLNFYKRNYIEGLFLSSGIIKSPDYTMEELIRVARTLREDHAFRGYIHLKLIPNADPRLLEEAGRWADRVSVNIELPKADSLEKLAPRKEIGDIRRSMGHLRGVIDEQPRHKGRSFAPAGQSTQMIVGADDANDGHILTTSAALYGGYKLKRVYYSAFSPIPDASKALPLKAAPLIRENRLYQADWLMRFYGFDVAEIVSGGEAGMLSLDMDPKLAWALKHRERFPLDVNLASREELLRVPGLGVRTVDRILSSRRVRSLRGDDLARLKVPLRKVSPFIVLPDHRPTKLLDRADLQAWLKPPSTQQLDLFAA
ncbi:putative DNA modification/repair radical SAM protein [Alsobacter metallidurans]|uniref:DNA modification/repair radical SAM protein n=1 Tax=Alsobacter metallidurans TaxID=340221 RepID=A0A917IBS4_9HYPH|nr:putative DNA modification/repair radical SAM protein [Alsobacter metallidurans]GGH30723.1 putative DNA modification/repair radical SAM protein [Alsobacter metallidurans]